MSLKSKLLFIFEYVCVCGLHSFGIPCTYRWSVEKWHEVGFVFDENLLWDALVKSITTFKAPNLLVAQLNKL